jgi:ferredoxin
LLGVRVNFKPLGIAADAKPNETILDVARRAGAPLGNSCGGVGICGRCRITILDGEVSPPTRYETNEKRLACQAVVMGDCSVTTSYW